MRIKIASAIFERFNKCNDKKFIEFENFSRLLDKRMELDLTIN